MRLIARRNASGETDARELRGALLPLGAVTPHAIFSPRRDVARIPATIALQMLA